MAENTIFNSRMPELARMLGVEPGQCFGLKQVKIETDDFCTESAEINNLFFFTGSGLVGKIVDGDRDGVALCNDLIPLILTGTYDIVPVPRKLIEGSKYYYVDVDGTIRCTFFNSNKEVDLLRVKIGNCFSAKVSAEQNKDKIMQIYTEITKALETGNCYI